ncbi:HD domain-containing protein [Aquihabitans sp. McL0605]|uniref:HD domain-containing protein n=1 Tax=Aquihabitans sp. McL0605 TaxID=3415671 RepID=UPI003CF0274E
MPAASVADVLALFDGWASDPYDEEVSQLDHALQTAALAVADGATDELVAAALLHDVGHLLDLRDRNHHDHRDLDDAVDLHHEARGARWLAPVFPPAVTGPIALHVAAKRYRCAVEPTYHQGLSAGSTASLERQGGPMAADEVAAFEKRPTHLDAVRLRAWDDGGKVDGLAIPPLATYVPLLERVAAAS